MIVYVENLKESIKKLLELISDYSKVARYRVSIQTPITFQYTSNEQLEFEIKNPKPFTLAPKLLKYLGINLTNYVQTYMQKTTKF